MGLTGFTEEMSSPISADRLFKALILDFHNLLPKVLPDVVVSAAIVEGDGGVGSIKEYCLTDAAPVTYVKERVDILDKEKLECKFSVIEGGDIRKKLESATNHIKFEALENGGCVSKLSCEYKSLDGIECTEEEMKAGKDGLIRMYKAVEAYLVANPDVYT